MSLNIAEITKDQAIQRARNYKGAKDGLQLSIAWAVGQALNGNADGLFMVMSAAQLIANRGGEMTTLADGRAVWKYLTTSQDAGGVGLAGIIRWDKESSRFKMAKSWKAKAEQLDMAALVNTLSNTRWDAFKAVSAAKAFDLDKAIKSLVTRAANNGVTEDEVVRAFEKLRAA